jgi:heat-inducible transcriptional repressor
MSELAPRQQTILRAIIIEYVNAAEPIGSEALVQKYELGVRAATVRNEMAEMSDLGYLEQPHTSAGRIPSDQGYRYYVDHMSAPKELSDAARGLLRQSTGDGDALQGMLRQTAQALSRLTHLLTVATTVRDQETKVNTALLSALGPQKALLVLVLSNGHVENRLIECPAGLTLQDVGTANEQLAQMVTGKTLQVLTRAKAPVGGLTPAVDRLQSTLWGAIRQVSRDLTRGVMVTEGEEFMYAKPEFHRDLGKLNEILEQLSQMDLLYEAVAHDSPQVVTIGRENKHGAMQQLSVVRHAFSIGDRQTGMVAVIGPTRMDYDVSIPLVSYTARALSDSLTKFFG